MNRSLPALLGTLAMAGSLLAHAQPDAAASAGAAVASDSTPTPPQPATAPCLPSGKGRDYQVGPDKEFGALDQVPWDRLKGGDTVRIFPSPRPYAAKFMVSTQGSASAPLRICGVRGPNGERPVIDGQGAITPPALDAGYGNSKQTRDIHQDRSLILIKQDARDGWTAVPSHIQIDGLKITHAHPQYRYTNAAGEQRPYAKFGACIWVERGHHITIADNEIADCTQAVFSKATDDGDFARTTDLRIVGNTMYGHGNANSWYEHTTYTQGVGITIEFNRYGPMRASAGGNQLKDRSAGTVVRYNHFVGGAHSLDLVEAEDFPTAAVADPAYRRTYVYGNLIEAHANQRAVVHYGGDHFGSKKGERWGEPIFRKGTLYFFHNTVIGTGESGRLFRISTTDETVQAWNNIFQFAGTVSLREGENDAVGRDWKRDGNLNLGRNWISASWNEGGRNVPLEGLVSGRQNLASGKPPGLSATQWVPAAGSAAIDAALPPTGEVAQAVKDHPVQQQFSGARTPAARSVRGAAADLGAIER